MKRFIVITALFSVSILAAWVIFGPLGVSQPEIKTHNPPIKVQEETGETLKANQPAYGCFSDRRGYEDCTRVR